MNSSWVTSLIVIRHLGKFEFPSNQPNLHLFLPYPKHMLRAHYISMSLATVIWEYSLNQFLLLCS